jgi:hypothetical protein
LQQEHIFAAHYIIIGLNHPRKNFWAIITSNGKNKKIAAEVLREKKMLNQQTVNHGN